jgi:hypothetical protein
MISEFSLQICVEGLPIRRGHRASLAAVEGLDTFEELGFKVRLLLRTLGLSQQMNDKIVSGQVPMSARLIGNEALQIRRQVDSYGHKGILTSADC